MEIANAWKAALSSVWRPLRVLVLCGIAQVCAGSASALVVLGDDLAKTLVSPSAALGWEFVGARGRLTAVYIGRGWVLTAHHVPPGDIVLEGVRYTAVPDSAVRLRDPSGGAARPDLAAFRIQPLPDIGELEIRSTPLQSGEPVILVGCGHDRGPAMTWRGISGFALADTQTKRWGMNRVAEAARDYELQSSRTRAFSTRFDPFDTLHEAQAAGGDSGGAVFTRRGSRWELAGVLFSVERFAGQPGGAALYGNRTIAVDLSHYREQLLALTRAADAPPLRKSEAGPGDGVWGQRK